MKTYELDKELGRMERVFEKVQKQIQNVKRGREYEVV